MHFAPRFPDTLAADGAPSLMKENGVTFPFTACKRHYMRETRCCQGLFFPSLERIRIAGLIPPHMFAQSGEGGAIARAASTL